MNKDGSLFQANMKVQSQLVGNLKKTSSKNINEKYQAYLVSSPDQQAFQSRQAVSSLGYQTQQILPINQYNSRSLQQNVLKIGAINTFMPVQHQKNDQFKIGTNKMSKGGSPSHQSSSHKKRLKGMKQHNRKQRKSISKENQSLTSSRGASQFIQEMQKQYNTNQCFNPIKNKSRIVKSSIKNQNSTLNEHFSAIHNQNLSDINSKSPQSRQELTSLEQATQRLELFENKLKKRVSNLQQNYQSLPSNSKTQRGIVNGKAIMRNNSQLKIKSQINGSAHLNVETLEKVNNNFLSGYSQSTKNQNSNNNHIFSMSQSSLRNYPKDSFQLSQQHAIQRQGTSQIQDIQNESTNAPSMSRPSNSNKMQQKIQKIIQATQQSTTINSTYQQSHLQNSYSQSNLRKSLQSNSGMPKIYRPSSLKQLMPTIDEQIMRLTENNNAGSPTTYINQQQQYQYQQSSLFKCLADQANKIQQSQNRPNQVNNQHQQQHLPNQPSQFRGQIVKSINNTNHQNRNIPIQFNHKESIEGSRLTQDEKDKINGISLPTSVEGISPVKAIIQDNQSINDNNSSMQSQLKDILMKTQFILAAHKKNEKEIQRKCDQQQNEIQQLKNIIEQYEQLIPKEQHINY